MHSPLVGERVWVGGCTSEFIVVHANYCSQVATLSRVEPGTLISRCPFQLLFSGGNFEDFEISEGVSLIASSQVCIQAANVSIRDMRRTANRTCSVIQKTQELISQTDETIARWKCLGCEA